ncbi:MAG: flagellar biosynthetic protein FliR [Spirochaetaceae bacterium]|jgi:flagellar biosynthetic protein FliR|nr:flagellar biosynthetic protein FliR [Spirochaetaceae bacterium]
MGTETIIDEIIQAAPLFLLIAARALALIETAPLLSSDSISQIAKIALSGFAAYSAFPSALESGWEVSAFTLNFVLLLVGEGLIGIIMGFFITIVFAAFSTAGQFFSLQMGFGASETFDPLAQVENPLLGQFLNLIAMLVFLSLDGFQLLFIGGFWRSLQSLSVFQLIAGREIFVNMLLSGLSRLFLDAIIISMPILGTLFLVSLSTGLISKTAPQINILSEGFPISIMVAFILIIIAMPFMTEAFSRVISAGFRSIETIFQQIGVQP